MRETYDASIGGRKGLLYVGYGAAGDGGDGAAAASAVEDATTVEGTMIRFVREDDGEVPLSFDASRLLSCDAKGRYRMVVVHEECTGGGDKGEPGEKRLTVVRVRGTAVDRVIGAVLDLAERAEKGDGQEGGGDDGPDPAAAAGIAAAAATTTAIAAAPAGTGGFDGTRADGNPTVDDAVAAPPQPQPARAGCADGG